MHALRIPIAALAGALFTSSMFWLLWSLVETTFDVGDRAEAARIEFSRMRRDTEVATKRDEKVERERPPPTPETPRMAFSAGGIDNNVAQLTPDRRRSRRDVAHVDVGRLRPRRHSAGSHQPRLSAARVEPRARRMGAGAVHDHGRRARSRTPIVVNAEPKNIFDDAALKAIARWRYNPKVDGGVAVERVGVQTIIRFQLEQ